MKEKHMNEMEKMKMKHDKEKHMDAKEDKKMVKKMVKKDCYK